MMPFTYSIANGVSIGIITYVLLNGIRNILSPKKGGGTLNYVGDRNFWHCLATCS